MDINACAKPEIQACSECQFLRAKHTHSHYPKLLLEISYKVGVKRCHIVSTIRDWDIPLCTGLDSVPSGLIVRHSELIADSQLLI